MKKQAALFLLFLTPQLYAADVPVNGADKPVPQYGYAELSVKVEKGDQVLWDVTPEPVKVTDHGDGMLIFSGKPGSTFQVRVFVFNFDAKTLNRGKAVVTFAGEAPDPVPPPDGPVDPAAATLLSKFRAAYELEDADDQALLPKMVQLYKDTAVAAGTDGVTYRTLFAKAKELSTAAGLAGHLPILFRATQKETAAKLPTGSGADMDAPLTVAQRKKAVDTFTNISNTLAKIK